MKNKIIYLLFIFCLAKIYYIADQNSKFSATLLLNSFKKNSGEKTSLGLAANDIIASKKILYDHFADQKKINRWDSQVVLKPINMSFLPKYIKDNKEKFKDWLDL